MAARDAAPEALVEPGDVRGDATVQWLDLGRGTPAPWPVAGSSTANVPCG